MTENEIDIYSLKTICKLSKASCDNFSEAAAVCLAYNKHKQGVSFSINGDIEGVFRLSWNEVTEQIFASRDDYDYTAENGAYCLAMLIIQHKTEYNVVKQARKKTGFDYYLAKKEAELPFQSNDARLEVSGIRKELKEVIKEISAIISNTERFELEKLEIPQNTTIHNIHFKKGKGIETGVIATDILTSTLSKYEKLRIEVAASILPNKKKDEIKKIGRTEIVINKAASYSVFIRPKDEDITIPFVEFDTEYFKISERLKLLLYDIRDFEILKKIITNRKELSKLKSFLNEICNHEIEIDFKSYFVNKGKQHEFTSNRFFARKIIDNITQLEYSKESELLFEGHFLMLSLKSKQFEFLTDTNEEIKGKYIEDLFEQMNKVSFDHIYKVTILRREKKEVGTEEIITEDEMINIEI